MRIIYARNVQHALPMGLACIREHGVQRGSRNGAVLQVVTPVTTVFVKPQERVLFWAERDANPFFHLYESLWMLCGRNDVKGVARYVPRMKEFSDDGESLWGAYGWRWRGHFGYDQLQLIIAALRKNPEDRRGVLTMWDGREDLKRGQQGGKDVPCNTQAFFSVNPDGQLDMTVCNRSNDMIWGAYGANAVHFSFLQEYVALCLGRPVGRYWQVSNNYHAYLDTYKPLEELGKREPWWDEDCPYTSGQVRHMPFDVDGIDGKTFLEDVQLLVNENVYIGLRSQWLRQVAVPMLKAHQHFKRASPGHTKYAETLEIIDQVAASDWKLAAQEWVQRREKKWRMANEDGVQYQPS